MEVKVIKKMNIDYSNNQYIIMEVFLSPIQSPTTYYDCRDDHSSIEQFQDIFESSVDSELIEAIKMTSQGLNVEPWVLKVYKIYYDFYQDPSKIFSAYHYINIFWGNIEYVPNFMEKVIVYLEQNYLDRFETTPQALREFFVNINEVVQTTEFEEIEEWDDSDIIRILTACSW